MSLAIGLGGYEDIPNPENFIFKTMKQMMIENNHTYIDIVKMDIEGIYISLFQFIVILILYYYN